jgi:tetratricopeptide (TPR) repeat protein
MRDYVKALQAYQKVGKTITEEPFHSHALYRIGECYLALNDRKAALAAFAQVESKDPNNLWLRAAQSYIQSVEMEVNNGIRIFN